MLKSFVLFAALGLSIASAKSYDLTVTTPVRVGAMDLKPGKYSVAIMDESKVRFTDADGNAVEANATITKAPKKFANTLLDTRDANGEQSIEEIDLGGTNTKIQFE
jgi:hypothetical protein